MKKLLSSILIFAAIVTVNGQSRIPYATDRITIDIPDYVVNGTQIKRKAVLQSMEYNQEKRFLSLTWVVKSYADSSGQYGSYLAPQIADYTIRSVADNSVAVNPANGQILVADTSLHYLIDYMWQYDWFNMIGETQNINVHDLIREYGSRVSNWNKRR